MWIVHRLGREPIEAHQEDPPVNEFYTDEAILAMFEGFRVVETAHEHHRALPVAKRGLKAALYHGVFRPLYNLLPERLALRRLRRSLLACQDCQGLESPGLEGPGLEGCPLRAEFNLTIDSLVAEINQEWERS